MMVAEEVAGPAGRGPGRLVEVWAAGPDGGGQCGSGWVVGQSGVLTCRHVVEPYLAASGQTRRALQVRVAASSSPADWVDCHVAWLGPDSGAPDIVLIEV